MLPFFDFIIFLTCLLSKYFHPSGEICLSLCMRNIVKDTLHPVHNFKKTFPKQVVSDRSSPSGNRNGCKFLAEHYTIRNLCMNLYVHCIIKAVFHDRADNGHSRSVIE